LTSKTFGIVHELIGAWDVCVGLIVDVTLVGDAQVIASSENRAGAKVAGNEAVLGFGNQ
jgi:hypothetical protein